MNKILLDTNAFGKYIGGDHDVLTIIAESDIVYFSCTVIGELIAGFHGGTQYSKNREKLEQFISKSSVSVLPIGFETAQIYGEIKNELKKNGTPIPINDIWIAASTVETGSVLITYDKHFLKIPGLRTWYHLKEL